MKKEHFLILTSMLFCLGAKALVIKSPEMGRTNSIPVLSETKDKKNSRFSPAAAGFIENKGQIKGFDGSAHPEVKYLHDAGNVQIYLLENGIAYQFTKVHYPEGYKDLLAARGMKRDLEKLQALQKQIRVETFRMDMTLLGANTGAEISAEGKSVDYTNYYNHNILDVYQYEKITYHQVYPGIDWVIYCKNGEVKYDFVVKPGADPSRIKMEFTHQEDLALNQDGSYTLKSILGSISEKKPLSFQDGKAIETQFLLKDNTLAFSLGNYDPGQDLLIDPILLWATYYGGTNDEAGYDLATDTAGNVYFLGFTNSNNGIAAGGHQNTHVGFNQIDVFLVKFNAAGVRQWGTYYGGDLNDWPSSCTTDRSGNVFLAGTTLSTVNIASAGHQNTYTPGYAYDGFLVKFNAGGIRQWGTYYGGAGSDDGQGCATDASGNVYLSGTTSSSVSIASGGHQNTKGGTQDAYLVKFNAAGVRQWATYYGGTSGESGSSCATDPSGNIYLSGLTGSSSDIASSGHQNNHAGGSDAYLVKFTTNGVRLWGTYYGGTNDEGGGCTTDASGNVYLVGTTGSAFGISFAGFQMAFGGATDAYVVKFNSAGARQWASYYGGTGDDDGTSCSVDAAGNVYVAGSTTSGSGIAFGGHQNTHGGTFWDSYLVKFNSTGLRQWASYYGGALQDYGMGCTTASTGIVYLTGQTRSTNLFTSGGHQNTFGGGDWEAFLVKFCLQPLQITPIAGNSVVCSGASEYYSVVLDSAASSYNWSLPGGFTGTSTTNVIHVTPQTAGVVSVSASNACGATPVQTLYVVVDACAGISHSQDSGDAISVFPNPATGELTIRFENDAAGEVVIYDPKGAQVYRAYLKDRVSNIDISSQPNGVYFIEIRQGGNAVRRKIIKE